MDDQTTQKKIYAALAKLREIEQAVTIEANADAMALYGVANASPEEIRRRVDQVVRLHGAIDDGAT